jgi:hypothetical protein
MDKDYAATRGRHAREVQQALQRSRLEGIDLNKAAVFEQIAPVPL